MQSNIEELVACAAGQHPAREFRRGCAPFVGILQGGWPPFVRVGEAGSRAEPAREGGILETVR